MTVDVVKKGDDRSEEHLTWLLASRATNMAVSKRLFLIVRKFSNEISSNVRLQEMAQELSGVSFSLWRSVFLSDLSGDIADQVADLEEFLGNLISNNTIAYPQDKNTKEFTFRYYLANARLRLSAMERSMPAIVKSGTVSADGGKGIKADWTLAQEQLAKAIEEFDLLLAGP